MQEQEETRNKHHNDNTEAKTEPGNTRENRKIVTPYAFGVSSHLIGIPLAAPWRRGLALSLDLLLITMLTAVPDFVLALLMAWLAWRISGKIQREGLWMRILVGFLRTCSFVIVFVVAIVALEPEERDEDSTGDNSTPEQIVGSNKQQTDEGSPTEAIHIRLGNKSESRENRLVEWFQSILQELGLGLGWAAFYFTVFSAWWRGQTPAKKLLGIRVIKLDGAYMSLWESFGRYGGYGAGLATGLLGFLQIFWDPNRQAIQDKISETLVITQRRESSPREVTELDPEGFSP